MGIPKHRFKKKILDILQCTSKHGILGVLTLFSFLQCTSLRIQCFLCGDNYGLHILHLLACFRCHCGNSRWEGHCVWTDDLLHNLVVEKVERMRSALGRLSDLDDAHRHFDCLPSSARHVASLHRRIHMKHKTNAQTMTAFCFWIIQPLFFFLIFFGLYSLSFFILFFLIFDFLINVFFSFLHVFFCVLDSLTFFQQPSSFCFLLQFNNSVSL